MGKSSWKYFERRIAKKIADLWGLKYNENILRTPGSGSMSNFKGDIIVIGENFPLHIECKFGYEFSLEDIIKNKASIKSFVKQAEDDSPEGKVPVVILSRPYYGVYVIIDRKHILLTKFWTNDLATKLTFYMITENYLVISVEDLKTVFDGEVFSGKRTV
jgi:Holliday junction resolvase